MELKFSGILGAGILVCCMSTSQAALIDGGGGLVYDDVLDITWLTDANLAYSNTFGISTGIDVDGYMDWDTANMWIDAMNSSGYMGYSSWRMPTVTPVNGVSFDYTVTYDGSTDKGFNNYSTSNELSHLFYSTLGNSGQCLDTSTPETGCIYNTDGWGLDNTGPFENMSSFRYWTEVEHTELSWRAFDFSMGGGQTGTGAKVGAKQVWAVLDGDVAMLAAVPVPAAAWLFGSGLVGLIAIGRRKGVRSSQLPR